MTEPDPLVLDDVTRIYGEGRNRVEAVRDVSLAVSRGEIVAIIGPSGSGKTTLLSIAGCLLPPTAGVVSILGQDVSSLGQSERATIRRHHIGFVFQAFNLLAPLNARENIEIALNVAGTVGEQAVERAGHLLAMLELEHVTARRPGSLSGGEQQRLAVARALANRPDLILADEPTASLDSVSGHRVMELMRQAVDAREASALVVVTHDVRVLDVANRVLSMEDGRLSPSAAAVE